MRLSMRIRKHIFLLLTALHGGWNIFDITVLFVVNLGN